YPQSLSILCFGLWKISPWDVHAAVDQHAGAGHIAAPAAPLHAFPHLAISAEISLGEFEICTELGD
ncbi:MAG: hypothetical protein ACRD3W_01625, partial [Terriglobales bacterium]